MIFTFGGQDGPLWREMTLRTPILLLCFVTGACATDDSLHRAHRGVPTPALRMSTGPTGFTITFTNVAQADLSNRSQEQLRRHFIRDMSWQAGGCTPQKRYRIVGRSVTQSPDERNVAMVAAIEYTARCIRHRGCATPPEEWMAEVLTARAIRERAAGRPYYEGCQWLERRLRRSNRRHGGAVEAAREEGER